MHDFRSRVPSEAPTLLPTDVPTVAPSQVPSLMPSIAPTTAPTDVPTAIPTISPTDLPTLLPTELAPDDVDRGNSGSSSSSNKKKKDRLALILGLTFGLLLCLIISICIGWRYYLILASGRWKRYLDEDHRKVIPLDREMSEISRKSKYSSERDLECPPDDKVEYVDEIQLQDMAFTL